MLDQKTSPDYVTIDGEPSVWDTISYSYYKNGRVKTVSDSTGAYMEYTYDAPGNTESQKAKINEDKYSVEGYQYDASGRLIKKWDEIDAEDLKDGGTGKIMAETIFEYDRNGNIIKVVSPEGYVVTFEYDDMDRLTAKNEEVKSSNIDTKYATALVTSSREIFYPGNEYEFKVEMSSDEEVAGLSMEIEYDSRIFEPAGAEPASGISVNTDTIGKIRLSAQEVNYSGNITLATLRFKIKEGITGTGFITISPKSTYTSVDGIEYRFTETIGKVAAVKEPDMNGDGNVEVDDFTLTALLVGVKVGDAEYQEKYDIDGSGVIDISDLDYIKDTLFADSSIQLEELDRAKFTQKWTSAAYRDKTNTEVRTTTYKYDKAGNLTSEADTNGNTVTYSYDAYNRLISVTDKSGATSRVYYDEEGRRIKEILPQNYNPELDDGPGATYSYDTMGRLAEIKDELGSVVQKNIYEANGLITWYTNGPG